MYAMILQLGYGVQNSAPATDHGIVAKGGSDQDESRQ